MERAVESAKSAFSTWSKTTPLARQQVVQAGFIESTLKLNGESPDNVQIPAADKGKLVRDSKTHHSGAGSKKIVEKNTTSSTGQNTSRCRRGCDERPPGSTSSILS